MAEKKAEQKPFDPIQQAANEALDIGFFGDRHWNPERFVRICAMRGYVGREIWDHKTLSPPLRLFVQATKDVEEEKLNALLHSFATTLGLDENAVRRHFFAIKFAIEEQFLAAVELAEKQRTKLKELAQEAENEVLPTEEPTEPQKTIEEEEEEE